MGVNRDLFMPDSFSAAGYSAAGQSAGTSITETYYREFKNSGTFPVVFELNRNMAGYSKDVHG